METHIFHFPCTFSSWAIAPAENIRFFPWSNVQVTCLCFALLKLRWWDATERSDKYLWYSSMHIISNSFVQGTKYTTVSFEEDKKNRIGQWKPNQCIWNAGNKWQKYCPIFSCTRSQLEYSRSRVWFRKFACQLSSSAIHNQILKIILPANMIYLHHYALMKALNTLKMIVDNMLYWVKALLMFNI